MLLRDVVQKETATSNTEPDALCEHSSSLGASWQPVGGAGTGCAW